MSTDPLYRRQFLLTSAGPDRRASWNHVAIDGALRVAAHPDLPVHQVRRSGVTLTLLGFVLDPLQPEADDRQILARWLDHLGPLRDVFRLSARCGGRWVIIVSDERQAWLLHDLAGFRTVTYTADRGHGLWCASDARLLADELGLTPDPDLRAALLAPFRYRDVWLPGEATPYRECRALLPNHYLDLHTRTVHRYWPDRPRQDLKLEDGVEQAAVLLRGLMAAARHRFPLALGLTAGQDSRLLLAAARDARDDLYCYTIERRGAVDDSGTDVRIPAEMLPRLGLPHHVIRCADQVRDDIGGSIRGSLAVASDFRVHEIQSVSDHIRPPRVRVSGHVGELGRGYYRRDGADTLTGADLAAYARRGGRVIARPIYQDWLDAVAPLARRWDYHVLDLFYQEFRLARWAAAIQAQYDAVLETFTPFNCRRLVETFLAVDEQHRRGKPLCEMYAQLIHVLWPELLAWPFNPEPRWRRLSKRALASVGLFKPVQRFVTRG